MENHPDPDFPVGYPWEALRTKAKTGPILELQIGDRGCVVSPAESHGFMYVVRERGGDRGVVHKNEIKIGRTNKYGEWTSEYIAGDTLTSQRSPQLPQRNLSFSNM
jgi:hypothetical protein